MLPPAQHPPAATLASAPDAAHRSARTELWVVAGLTLATFVLACVFELRETVTALTEPLEVWQLDEVPIALTMLAAGLAWYAFRRRSDAIAELHRRERAEEKAMNLLSHNRELAQRLLSVQESERRALARELHDELGQRCNAIRVEAAYIQRTHDRQQIGAAAQRVAAQAEALYQEVRDLLRNLRPAELDELGLVAALQALCETWEERSGIACIFHHDGDLDTLGEAVPTALYRVAQEALNNVLRHADATRVRISLQYAADGHVLLQVEDDGCGFEPATDTRGLGLLGAAERAAALGGTLHVDSAPGRGTRLRMSVPLVTP